jgi:hypothetical protein
MGMQLYDLAGAESERRFSPYCWRIKLALMHKGLPDRRHRAHPDPLLAAGFTNQGFGTEDGWRVVIRPGNERLACQMSNSICPQLFEVHRSTVV